MTGISKNWLDLSVNSNILKPTYINGFNDVSNNIVGRENLWIQNQKDIGDTRLGLGTVDPSFMIDIMSDDPIIRFTNASIDADTQNNTSLGAIDMVSPSNNNVTASTIICQNIHEEYDDNGLLTFSTGGGNVSNAEAHMALSQDTVTFGTSNTQGLADYTDENTNCRIYGNVECDSVFSNGSAPIGSIMMWRYSIISNSPSYNGIIHYNWKRCDGTTYNGITTPDLRNQFVVGSGSSYKIGDTGGKDSVSLTTSTMPSHSHTVRDGGSHRHQIRVGQLQYDWDNSVTAIGADDHSGSATLSVDELQTITNSHTHTIYNAGSGTAHENRPPYYALMFFMRIA